jgi:hypothetical protein
VNHKLPTTPTESLLAQIRATLDPGSLESRMDASIGTDSEVVRHVKRLIASHDERRQLERDQLEGDRRRGGAPA